MEHQTVLYIGRLMKVKVTTQTNDEINIPIYASEFRLKRKNSKKRKGLE